jgi:Tfp pilus assembly PilM family ATPase
MSGYTANVIAHHGVLEKVVNFIQKPFSLDELGEKLKELLQESGIFLKSVALPVFCSPSPCYILLC